MRCVRAECRSDDFTIELLNSVGELELWRVLPDARPVTPELLRAVAHGQVTAGGMAEAGWHFLGKKEYSGEWS